MNGAQTLDLQINIGEQNPAVVPIHVERALPLHRLGKARRQENISRRSAARRLGITIEDVVRQECTTADLPLSMLHKWAKALALPVAQLVAEPDTALSTPLFNRAHLVRVMKTAMALLEQTGNLRTKRLAQTMIDQLMEIMPELRGISAAPAVGKRRNRDDLGIAAQRSLSDKFFQGAVN
jgi:transcriptional regulator with XRE-family HTH domain